MNLNEQLRILAIFHYVVGGLHALFGCFGLIHFFIGISFIFDPSAWDSGSQAPPPFWFGYLFAIIGGGFVLFGWILGTLTIISGRCISRRKRRVFSIVMGGVNCAMMPFGTVLGVFDLILLSKDETKLQYAEQGAAANPYPLRGQGLR